MSTPKDRLHQKPVTVYTAANLLEARMVQEVLHKAGIESMLQGPVGEVVSGIYAATMGDWARQDILVLESAAAEAARILSELPEPNSSDADAE
ncbi:MAG: DUF2007 domain-containing protein [Acidobacteria bacterium]|nr:DUF2007 domain-containing protein [Acidobacteriota bacterium]